MWTDAYLCAFAETAGLTLVTLDRKMAIRDEVRRLILSS
jgi:predicted nucleic acid-binding protein